MMSRISLLAGVLVVSFSAFAETRVFFIGPNGEEEPTPIVISSVDPDDYTVVLRLWLEDTVSAGLGPMRVYSMTFPCDASPLGASSGTVAHDIDGPTACGALSPCEDLTDPTYPFAPGTALPGGGTADCDCVPSCILPRSSCTAIFPSGAVDVVEPAYIAELTYTASLDARGEWGVTIVNPDVGRGGNSYIRSEPLGNILFDFADPMAIISIPVAECFDGVQCLGELTKYECLVEQSGLSWDEHVYGDVFPIGNPNGVVDFDDILCILNGFANEEDCPAGDIIGSVFECPPGNTNGIDFDDILFALDAFAGNPACTLCP